MARRKLDVLENNQLNIYIGQRIRLRRDMLGLTQKALAEATGVTFQQIQKYENGETRIVAERLFEIALALEAPVSFLFAGLPYQTPVEKFISVDIKPDGAKSPDADDPLSKNESLELIKLYWALPNDALRRNVANLLRTMRP